MKEISLLEMLKCGVHFGHQKKRWHPKMKPYIYSIRSGIHIINLEQTAQKLEQAASFAVELAKKGGRILFVATKRQAQPIFQKAARETKMPFVIERWIGGTLTNFDNISKLVNRLKDLRDKKEKGELEKYTKRERLQFTEEIANLEKLVGGIENLSKQPDALFIDDVKKERTAIREASKNKIPIIAIVDTNNNPELVDYPIPANDDATKSIEYIVNYMAEAIKEVPRDKNEPEEKDKDKDNK
ncbi:30S ribosomal protein S2 [Patescibacteria group bacterium]|nr:30S ribosomal protein S2 [Patescibacteria group bacterium]MBU0963674.1 30S ribosomal protein S2 [Patescibacteria group bacterium]